MSRLPLLAIVLVVSLGNLADAQRAPNHQTKPTRPKTRTAVRQSSLDVDYFRYRLGHSTPKVRLRAISDLARKHKAPEAVGLLIEYIQSRLDAGEFDNVTSHAVLALGRIPGEQARKALVGFTAHEQKPGKLSPFALEATTALAEINDIEHNRALIELLDSPDFRQVILATVILGNRRLPVAFQPIVTLEDHPEYAKRYGLRLTANQAIASFNSPEAIGVLIKRLATTDGQLKLFIVKTLTMATGRNFGADSRAWQHWWRNVQGRFNHAKNNNAGSVSYPWDYAPPTFYGYSVYAKNVVFVIDKSATMNHKVGKNETRLDRAKRELTQVVLGLPGDAKFQIFTFDGRVKPLNKLVQATDANKQAAVRAVLQMSAGGSTNIHGALEMGLHSTDQLEAMYLLSDGMPTSGKIQIPNEIVADITRQNLFRRVSINIISVGNVNDLMKRLANLNMGQHRLIK